MCSAQHMDRVTGYYHYYYYYYSPVLPPVAGLGRDPNVVPPPVAGSSPRTKRKSKPATGGRNRDYRHFGKNKKQHAYAPLSVYLHSGSSASGSSAGSGSVREHFKKRTRQASECQASLVQHWRRIARPKGRPIPDPVPADLAKESRKMIVPWLEQRKLGQKGGDGMQHLDKRRHESDAPGRKRCFTCRD